MSDDKCVYVVAKRGDKPSIVPCEPGLTSDGYHTFDELYEHRCLLFCAWAEMARFFCHQTNVYNGFWKSRKHHDGSEWDGWFIAGIDLNTEPEGSKQITYHLPDRLWNSFHAEELESAPPYDGHNSNDVLKRIEEWIKA